MDYDSISVLSHNCGLTCNYGINYDNGCNLITWIYDAFGVGGGNTAHHSFENRVLLYAIDYLVNSVIAGIKPIKDLFLVFSEMWFEVYNYKTDVQIKNMTNSLDSGHQIDSYYSKDNSKIDNFLGLYYKRIDVSKSYFYFKSAYDAGFCNNYLDFIDVCSKMSTSEAYHYLIDIAKKYSLEGDPEAMGRLGRAYRDGKGVKQDLLKAAEWMRKAREHKIGWAEWELFDILYRINTPESLEEAVSIARPLAESGNRELQACIGRAYRDGKGVPQDLDKAAEWMRRAADKNVGWAKNELERLIT